MRLWLGALLLLGHPIEQLIVDSAELRIVEDSRPVHARELQLDALQQPVHVWYAQHVLVHRNEHHVQDLNTRSCGRLHVARHRTERLCVQAAFRQVLSNRELPHVQVRNVSAQKRTLSRVHFNVNGVPDAG